MSLSNIKTPNKACTGLVGTVRLFGYFQRPEHFSARQANQRPAHKPVTQTVSLLMLEGVEMIKMRNRVPLICLAIILPLSACSQAPTSQPTLIPTPTIILTNTPIPTPTIINTNAPIPTPTIINTPEPITIEGRIADCRHPYGALIGVPDATVKFSDVTTTTDEQGYFQITLPYLAIDPYVEISADGYVPYSERPSKMVNGAFHLIPKDLYQGVYLVLWHEEGPNPHNWHRKWETQTEFVIVRQFASEEQINDLLKILATDRYRDMTGGRFTSSIPPVILETMPPRNELRGKTVISFAPDIIPGGTAFSNDENGVIDYAEIRWNRSEIITENIVWHEMVHTVTAGGHINEWPSVVSEVESLNGDLSQIDIEIFNCIYNSPPKRSEPKYNP